MGGKCPVRPVDGVASGALCRNGSESREMLPLWIGRRAGASGTVSCEPWKEPVVQELFGLSADDEGLLGADGEDGTGDGAEAVNRDASVPAVNCVGVIIVGIR